MSSKDLRAHYLDYLAALNDRRLDDLRDFVAPQLEYNGRSMTDRDYRDLLEDDLRRIPDLVFDAQQLVVDVSQVACRLQFDCTPREEFHDLRPDGSRVVFTEHVFYRFEDRRMVAVWSLLDLAALQRQWGDRPSR